jgi:hypothetical protein
MRSAAEKAYIAGDAERCWLGLSLGKDTDLIRFP